VKTTLALAKADVGLSLVDNTADTAKPVSSATLTALNAKAPLASPAFTGTPTGITKAHVGLGSVDNTADTAKPISTFTQAALDLKANKTTIDVEDYRVVGNDLATLQAAFAEVVSGSTIRFGQGLTYTITSGLAVILSSKSDVTIDFNGATIEAPEVDNAIFTINGEFWANPTTVASAIAQGATTITTAGSGTLVAGDIITLRSSAEPFNPDRPTEYLKGEIARVAAVSGTTVTLESPTLYSYSVTGNTVTVGRITPVTRLTILHPSIIGAGSGDGGTAQIGVYVRYFDDCTIVRPHVVSAKRSGVVGMTGYNLKVTGGSVEDCNETGLGYGIRALSVDGVTFAYNKGRRNRHTLDADSFAPTSPIPSRNVFYFRNEAEDDSSAGISTHGGCDIAHVAHNITRNCGGGFVLRGRANTVVYNEVHGSKTHGENSESYQHAYLFGDDTPHAFGLGLVGIDLVFENNFADISNPRWATDDETSFGVYCTARLVRARIANNRLAGFSSHGMFFKGTGGDDVDITGNHLDCSGQTGTANGILLDPATAAAFTGLRIKSGNRISDATGTPIKIVGTGTASTGVEVIDNAYPGWSSGAPVDLTEGSFTDPTVGGGMVVSDGIRQLVQLTQAAYDLLTPDPSVMYVVVG
jgi:hypothetical protein